MLGTRNKERVLPAGTRLTAIGEALLKGGEKGGGVQLRRPRSGRPFHVSQRPFSDYVQSLGAIGRACRVAGVGFAGVGVCMLLAKAARARLAQYRARQFQIRLARAVELRRAAQAQAGDREPRAEAGDTGF